MIRQTQGHMETDQNTKIQKKKYDRKIRGTKAGWKERFFVSALCVSKCDQVGNVIVVTPFVLPHLLASTEGR